MNKYDISIILINYKTFDLICSCIDSIKSKSKYFSYEIIIVDNSCDEIEYKRLEEKFYSEDNILVVNPNANLGTSAGNNYGAKYAKGEFLLLLNSDTILINNAIYNLLKFAIENKCGVVGANLYDKNLKPTHSYILNEFNVNNMKKINSLFHSLKRILFRKRDDFNYTDYPIEIKGYICSAALLISRELYVKIGGSNEKLFMYCDDPLLCFDAKKYSKIYNVPSAKIIHLEGASDNLTFSDFKIKDLIYGYYTYLYIAYGKKDAVSFLIYLKNNYKIKSFLFRFINKSKYINYSRMMEEAKRFLKEEVKYGIYN